MAIDIADGSPADVCNRGENAFKFKGGLLDCLCGQPVDEM
jgi:hypothetical protein